MQNPLFRVVTRRKAAKTALVAGGTAVAAGSVGGCVIGSNGVDPAVIDAINNVLAGSCTVIATAETIAAVVAASFPAAAGVTTIATDIANQIAAFICNGVKQSSKNEQGKFASQPKAGAVDIHGWHIQNNGFVSF